LRIAGKGLALSQVVGEVINAYDKGQELGNHLNYDVVMNVARRDFIRAEWVLYVIDQALKADVIKNNDPKYIEDLVNFSLDDTKPTIKLSPNSFRLTTDEQKLNSLRSDFNKIKEFYNKDQREGFVELKIGLNKKQVSDTRKMKSKPR